MNPNRTASKRPHRPARLRQPARYALAACACAALVACGGGGSGTAGVGTGGTGSFAVGSINGLGSIYVNGVRFDTTAASLSNANAPAGAPAPTAADLALGMTVEVRGDINPNTQRGTAASVVIASEFKGAIDAVSIDTVNVHNSTLTLFGRTVRVTAATVYAGKIGTTPVTGLTQLVRDHVVEVYGLPQPDGSLRATRIEFEAADVGAFRAAYPNERFHVEGLLTVLSGTAPLRTFSVADVQFRETSAHPLPATLANNTEVTVSFAPTANPQPFDAVAVRVESRGFAAGVGLAEIEGLVSDLATPAPGVTTFRLNGFPVRVNATGVTFEYDGLVKPPLANGARVEVYGNVVAGWLVATKVEFEDEDSDEDPFEFAGVATCSPTLCATPAGSFTVRGVTIEYDAGTEFVDGASLATLAGMRVEVYARLLPAAAGPRFVATRVARDD